MLEEFIKEEQEKEEAEENLENRWSGGKISESATNSLSPLPKQDLTLHKRNNSFDNTKKDLEVPLMRGRSQSISKLRDSRHDMLRRVESLGSSMKSIKLEKDGLNISHDLSNLTFK